MLAYLRRLTLRPAHDADARQAHLIAADRDATQLTVAELPPCKFRDATAAFYAVVITDPAYPWAYLCPRHMGEHGPGMLGTGFGQRLVVVGTGGHVC